MPSSRNGMCVNFDFFATNYFLFYPHVYRSCPPERIPTHAFTSRLLIQALHHALLSGTTARTALVSGHFCSSHGSCLYASLHVRYPYVFGVQRCPLVLHGSYLLPELTCYVVVLHYV